MFRHLGVHVEPEPSMDVLLCRCHFAQPALVLLHRLCLIGKYITTSSLNTPGKVASGRSFKLTNEYSSPPILTCSSSSSSMLTLAIWLRALSWTNDSRGGRNGRSSFTSGLSARFTSRNI